MLLLLKKSPRKYFLSPEKLAELARIPAESNSDEQAS
jgi:hypothetical protein